jgi:hypothetical protein
MLVCGSHLKRSALKKVPKILRTTDRWYAEVYITNDLVLRKYVAFKDCTNAVVERNFRKNRKISKKHQKKKKKKESELLKQS